MKRPNLKHLVSFSLFVLASTCTTGCGDGGNQEDAGDAAEMDIPIDDSMDAEHAEPDIEDTTPDIVPEQLDIQVEELTVDCPPLEIFEGCELAAEDAGVEPAECPESCAVVPTGGDIGAPCVHGGDCNFGASCWVEQAEFYNGEIYITNSYGACVLYGVGVEGCDPDIPATCPSGSRCIFLGSGVGGDYYGCLDECAPLDSSMTPYDCNCGCREGYECLLGERICLSGCFNDRECCEIWWDLDGDFSRSSDEVEEVEGCTNVCDDEPAGLLQATYRCINHGDPTNRWSGPCRGDPHCPPDGRCLDEFHYGSGTGGPLFPGGICIKDYCDVVGRGCSEYGGGCVNIGTWADPYPTCLGLCHVGLEPTDPGYECRTTPGQEHACFPAPPERWSSPPGCGYDGYCFTGNFPGGSRDMGDQCVNDSECPSALGLGFCYQISGAPTPGFCSAYCNQRLAECNEICGGNDAAGFASGACLYHSYYGGVCLEACSAPEAPPGSNDCSISSMACYPSSMLSDSLTHSLAALMPPGVCIPGCSDDDWCLAFWGMTLHCDTTSGVCIEG
jgi:hypothetical protein